MVLDGVIMYNIDILLEGVFASWIICEALGPLDLEPYITFIYDINPDSSASSFFFFFVTLA